MIAQMITPPARGPVRHAQCRLRAAGDMRLTAPDAQI